MTKAWAPDGHTVLDWPHGDGLVPGGWTEEMREENREKHRVITTRRMLEHWAEHRRLKTIQDARQR